MKIDLNKEKPGVEKKKSFEQKKTDLVQKMNKFSKPSTTKYSTPKDSKIKCGTSNYPSEAKKSDRTV